MPARSDKSEEPEKFLLRPALFSLTTESQDCVQRFSLGNGIDVNAC